MSANPATHVVVEHPFAQIPEALLYDPTISADAVRVYGVLARHGADPSNCFPGYHRIAEFMGKSARSIPTWVRALEEAGWITRTPRWRRGDEVTDVEPAEGVKGWEPTANAYTVHAIKRATQRGVRAGERVPPRADERGGSALHSAHKESNGNESNLERDGQLALVSDLNASHRRPPPSSDFDHWWTLYPHKVAKQDASAAYSRARKKVTADVLTDGLCRSIDYWRRTGRPPDKMPNAATWLNGARWKDELAPSDVVIEH